MKVFYILLESPNNVLYFDVVIEWNIEAQYIYIFQVSLYTRKHLLLNRYRGAFRTQSNICDGAFTKTRNGLKALAIFLNSFILDAWLGSKYASEMCFSRVIFNRIDKWDSSDMETIQSVVCRVRLFLSTRLYQIHYFQSLSQQIHIKTHQQLYQNMVSKISTVNKKIMGLFLSI